MTRRIIAITTAVIALVAMLWWFLLWRPQTTRLNAARQSAAAAQNNENGLLAQIGTLHHLEGEVPQLRTTLATLQSELPPSAGLDDSIRQIYAAAQAAGASWQSLTPQLNAASDGQSLAGLPVGISSVTLSISVAGTYPQITSFVRHLYALPRLMVINSVNLASDGGTQLSASLTGSVFFKPAGGS